jgi:hypothetical protein
LVGIIEVHPVRQLSEQRKELLARGANTRGVERHRDRYGQGTKFGLRYPELGSQCGAPLLPFGYEARKVVGLEGCALRNKPYRKGNSGKKLHQPEQSGITVEAVACRQYEYLASDIIRERFDLYTRAPTEIGNSFAASHRGQNAKLGDRGQPFEQHAHVGAVAVQRRLQVVENEDRWRASERFDNVLRSRRLAERLGDLRHRAGCIEASFKANEPNPVLEPARDLRVVHGNFHDGCLADPGITENKNGAGGCEKRARDFCDLDFSTFAESWSGNLSDRQPLKVTDRVGCCDRVPRIA